MRPRSTVVSTRTALLRGALTRVSWGMADQGVSSLTNLAVGVVAAHSLGGWAFGAFSIVWVTYTLALNVSRGLATDPLVVRFSAEHAWGSEAGPLQAWRTAVARASGTSLLLGGVLGGLCVLVGGLVGDLVGQGLIALGIVLPVLLVQDSWRFAFFSRGRGHGALANDLVWAAALVPALYFASRDATVFDLVLSWGLASGAGALFGIFQLRLLPRPGGARHWLKDHVDLGPRYMIENTSNSLAAQIRASGLAAIAGLAAVGAVRGAELLLGPFFAVLIGLSIVSVPEASRVWSRAPDRLGRFCLTLGAGQAGAILVWGVALLAVPDSLGLRLLGSVWEPASALIIPATLGLAAAGFSSGAVTGLRAMGLSRRSLRAQLVQASGYTSGGLAGAALGYGALGSAWGVATGMWIAVIVWWLQLRSALRDIRPQGPSSGALAVGARSGPIDEDTVGEDVKNEDVKNEDVKNEDVKNEIVNDDTIENEPPRLSIGLPVYNGERYLGEALDCLLAQTFRDFELIISDNASTDGTEGICRRYADLDDRIRYIRQPVNIGAGPNHAVVVELARGALFKWAAHDDLYAPELLERCVAALDEHPSAVLAHSWTAVVTPGDTAPRLLEYPLATASASATERFHSLLHESGGDDDYAVIRTSVLRSVDLSGSHYHADRTMVAELALRGPFCQVPDWLYLRRDRQDRLSRAPGVRAWCSGLDPRRTSRLRHPMVRLLGEYVGAYVGAIWRAELSRRDRLVCGLHLAGWMARRIPSLVRPHPEVWPTEVPLPEGRVLTVPHPREDEWAS